ncbi:MAG: hypothetical protein PVI86_00985 [Phycisphaerae bacterium]|jgi:hypothetical protein
MSKPSMPTFTTSSDVDPTLSKRLNGAWLTRVRFGTLLLFWTMLASSVLTNAAAFVLPFLGDYFGATVTHSTLRWIHLIPTAASWPLLVGVFALTAPHAGGGQSAPGEGLRVGLRILASLEVAATVLQGVSEFTLDVTGELFFVLPSYFVGVGATLVGLLYLRHLCRRFGLTAIAHALRIIAALYLLLVLLRLGVRAWGAVGLLSMGDSFYYFCGSMVCWTLLWAWGVYMLRRFWVRVADAAEGHCTRCGYSLRGLTEPRCPECGQVLPHETGG